MYNLKLSADNLHLYGVSEIPGSLKMPMCQQATSDAMLWMGVAYWSTEARIKFASIFGPTVKL